MTTTLPESWPVVEVRVGPYFGTDGRPLEGERVTFEPRVDRLLLEEDTTIVRRIRSVTLDENGEGVVELPVSDDPDLSLTGWTWHVREKFRHGLSFDIDVTTADVAAGIDLVDVAPVAPSVPRYPGLALQVNGYEDHGAVSGTLLVDPSVGTHVLDATGPLVVTLDDAEDGWIVTLLVTSGAEDVTVDDVEATLTDGGFATFVRVRGVWVLASSGASGEAPVSDTTPPTDLTGLTMGTVTSTSIAFTHAASTDAESSVKYERRVTPSGGSATPWVTYTGTSHTITGLTQNTTYLVEVRPYSNGGTGVGASFSTTTPTTPGSILASDTFTDTNGTLLTAHTMDAGGITWLEGDLGSMIGGGAATSMEIQSNVAQAPMPWGLRANHFDAGTQRIKVSASMTRNGSSIMRLGFMIKADGSQAVWLRWGESGIQMYSTGADIGTIYDPGTSTGTLSLEFDGTNVIGRFGSTVIASAAKPSGFNGTRVAVRLASSDVALATMDNFQVVTT